jgi:inosine-uridine nucleoside N-ribohydrolase
MFKKLSLFAFVTFLSLTLFSWSQPQAWAQPLQNVPIHAKQDCVVIDNDFDIDDMMAIPLVMANKHVAAIINTEGYTLAGLGGSALARLIAQPDNMNPVPVIVGASYPGTRDVRQWPWLLEMRATMHRANMLFSGPLPQLGLNEPFETRIIKAVEQCKRITVLVLGPFTSFVRYSPLIHDRISSVVMSGKAVHNHVTGTKNKIGFNCGYDLVACNLAFTQLQSLQATWVEVPRQALPPYSPTSAMVKGLLSTGLPGSLKQALLSHEKSWRLDLLTGGNKSLLWDQLAAMYLLHPELYHHVSSHMEPTVSALEIQRLWTKDTNATRPLSN